jgi:hypothetical protein
LRSSGAAARALIHSRPLSSAGLLIVGGLVLGFGLRSATGLAQVSMLQAKSERQQLELEEVRRGAQQEINAMAARLGELQAQANRLNALGERLTRHRPTGGRRVRLRRAGRRPAATTTAST